MRPSCVEFPSTLREQFLPKRKSGNFWLIPLRTSANNWSTDFSTPKPTLTTSPISGIWFSATRSDRQTTFTEPTRFTAGSGKASTRTSLTTSSCERSSRPLEKQPATRRSSGIAKSTRSMSRLRTLPSYSSASAFSVPDATTIRSRSGARTTTTASPRFSRRSETRRPPVRCELSGTGESSTTIESLSRRIRGRKRI